MVNVAACLPESVQPAARKALAEIRDAEDRAHAEKAIKDFAAAYGAKYPRAAAKITDDPDQLLAFYAFPAEHWIHLRPATQLTRSIDQSAAQVPLDALHRGAARW